MKYYKGYKYQVAEDTWLQSSIYGKRVSHRFFELYEDGRLLIRAGYAWDGVTGFFDLDCLMSPSAGHDVLFQCQRNGWLTHDEAFHQSNADLRRWARERGCWEWLANRVFGAVEKFGTAHAALQPDKIYEAP